MFLGREVSHAQSNSTIKISLLCMHFTLSNDQRKYLGLAPISDQWDCVEFEGDAYRPKSWLYFDRNVLMRQVISSAEEYREFHYAEETKDRKFLLPKTKRGKAKKLTPSVLEARTPSGVYFSFSEERVIIASFATQTTFHTEKHSCRSLASWLNNFMSESRPGYLAEISAFAAAKRKLYKYAAGDFFAFKLDRTTYGFGRVLANITKLREEANLPKSHGLYYLMGKPVLVKVYCFKSDSLSVDLDVVKNHPSFPSEYVFDNKWFYGEYPILGNVALLDDELDFPISYGLSKSAESKKVLLQWGLIHKELSTNSFSKYLNTNNESTHTESPALRVSSPYLKDALGFNLSTNADVLNTCIVEGSLAAYWNEDVFGRSFDLRNPINAEIRHEVLKRFRLDPLASYSDNLSRKSMSGLRKWLGF